MRSLASKTPATATTRPKPRFGAHAAVNDAAWPSSLPTAAPLSPAPVRLQAKLKVNEPGDKYEQEADRVAEMVMRMPEPGVHRKCAKCEEEENSKTVQRKEIASAYDGATAPPIVHDVLRESGQPLDSETRAFFEPRFGADFSGVRVHTDAKASKSARAVNALAYTVGRDIVFGTRRYAPLTNTGSHLLAHELVHTIQQRDTAALREPIATSSPATQLGLNVQRQEETSSKPTTEVTLWEQLRDAGAKAIAQLITEHAGRKLVEFEKKKIAEILKVDVPTGPVLALQDGPRFVLHDTGKKPEGKTAEEQQKKEQARHEELRRSARGPLDLEGGITAWIPSAGDAVIARPDFFDPRRPTATEFEKRADIISQSDREKAFQKIWKATKPTEQKDALQRAFLGLELTPKDGESQRDMTARALAEGKLTQTEITDEQTKAKQQLTAPLPQKSKKGEKPHITTTAAWTIGEICAKLKTSSAKDMAATEAAAKDLTDGCSQLGDYFATRDPRLGSTVNVEIRQEEGSGTKTSPTSKLKPLPNPAYTSEQYENVKLVYLRAALQAGRFPEITTHFWIDRIAGDHADPRCFNLMQLYELIRNVFDHAPGSIYGVKPNYGTDRGTHNVWWNKIVCGGSPP